MYKCIRGKCALEWDYDPTDGKCPVCREVLVPKSMWKPKEPSKFDKFIDLFVKAK